MARLEVVRNVAVVSREVHVAVDASLVRVISASVVLHCRVLISSSVHVGRLAVVAVLVACLVAESVGSHVLTALMACVMMSLGHMSELSSNAAIVSISSRVVHVARGKASAHLDSVLVAGLMHIAVAVFWVHAVSVVVGGVVSVAIILAVPLDQLAIVFVLAVTLTMSVVKASRLMGVPVAITMTDGVSNSCRVVAVGTNIAVIEAMASLVS